MLLLRDKAGKLHAFQNACPRRPHALVLERHGKLADGIACKAHELSYDLDGRLVHGAGSGDLERLESSVHGALVLVRATRPRGGGRTTRGAGVQIPAPAARVLERLAPQGCLESALAADWKVLIEQWLETPAPGHHYLAPNQLLVTLEEGAIILQVFPTAPGRARLRRLDYRTAKARGAGRGAQPARAQRTSREFDAWLRREIEFAESTHTGLVARASAPDVAGGISRALGEFRAAIAELVRELGGSDPARLKV